MKHKLYKVSFKMPFRKLIDVVMDSKTGDVIVVDGKNYRIEAEPTLDLHQLLWSVLVLDINQG